MQIGRSVKIALNPATATNWCLWIILLMTVFQYSLIDPAPPFIALASIIGHICWFFAMKLHGGVMCSLAFGRDLNAQPGFAKPAINFLMGGEREKLPLFSVTLLAIFLFFAGMPFMFIQLF